ncbi:DUF1510 family protein [Sporosarcina sp. 179-K 8C2 HS]|uniref:YrrS family protein n=1 Tax=Sporosarcina sp. 179-K 8C2 HS TaxID=3142387 RepID=UPI00399FDCE5
MKGNDPRYSRVNRKKMRNKSNQLLNIMIGLVVVLIIIVGASIIVGNKDDVVKESAVEQGEVDKTDSTDNESQNEENDSGSESENEMGSDETGDDESADAGQSDSGSEETGESDSNDEGVSGEEETEIVKIVPDNDEIIMETVIDKGWQPVGTTQTGIHESKYDGESVDWNEKKKAISYATGHSEDELIFWKIKNGGGPQKSIGIVSTRDKSKKYRVSLEWVDGKGWKPVQMDILNTLDFEY